MATRDILDRQAGTIEYVLHTHGIRARVDGGKLSPRLAHFHLVLPAGVNPTRLSPLVPEIAGALGVLSCRLAVTEGGVYLEAPRPDPIPVRLLPLVQRVADVVPPATAALGLDTDGTPLLLRLNSPEVDPVIISGGPSSGKSSLLRGMALSLALHNSPERLRLLLLDCAGGGAAFRGMEGLPHLACPVASGPVDALVSLRWALRILARRTRMAGDELDFDDPVEGEPPFEYGPLQSEEPELVVLLDGADELCAMTNRRANAEAAETLRRLLLGGPGHGIHMVLSAERPDEIVGAGGGWGARIAGRVASPEQARLATGLKGSGAQGLLGAGDFLVTLNSELIRFQAAAVSDAELSRAVDLILASARAYPQPGQAVEPATGREPQAMQPRLIDRAWTGE